MGLKAELAVFYFENHNLLFKEVTRYAIWLLSPMVVMIITHTSILYDIAIYLPTILLVVLLVLFLISSKENPMKSQKFIKLNLKIIIASIILWLICIKNISLDYNVILDSDWTSANYLFTTESNINYYFYICTMLIFVLIFVYMLNLFADGVNTISLTMIYILLLNLQGNILILSCDNLMLLFLGMEYRHYLYIHLWC